jgi:tetratricopeptide (TPR) repeat protein
MSKKSKPAKKKNVVSSNPSQADRMLDVIGQQIFQEDYTGAVINCERLLNFLPMHSPLRSDVLAQLGTAQAMLQNYPQSYAAFDEALKLSPNAADLWYNRGMSSLYTLRIGQSLKDRMRAVELNTNPALSERFDEAVKDSREMVEESIQLRGPDFTLDQLIEQESLFQRGLAMMEAYQWDEAEQAFRQSIALADCLPQPWGNLGVCLLMQERYDECEAALKRALVFDPHYAIAKNNLKLLAESRRTGPPKQFGIQEPFKNVKMKQGITFISEQ